MSRPKLDPVMQVSVMTGLIAPVAVMTGSFVPVIAVAGSFVPVIADVIGVE
jgi:hypothetical protein